MALNQLPSIPSYYSPVQGSAVGAGPQSYASLAAAAEAERRMMMQRQADRQNAVMAGYGQQIANNRLLGDQAYNTLAGNYDQVTADAAATRERNMGRVNAYGASMRNDLAVQNQRALAAASQAAIKRGLGNTTIQDSLVRGQNFDNTRQMMSLEDQLLQNRIATDSQLSGVYQSALQNRAGALNSQFNQNIGTENQLNSQRLGYLGGIQDDTQGFDRVSNLYNQLWQMQNTNNQAELDRQARNPSQSLRSPVRLGMPRRSGWL